MQWPHLHLAHGGHTDFRGCDGCLFNFLSARDLSLNVRTTASDFWLRDTLVHGTFMTEVPATPAAAPSPPDSSGVGDVTPFQNSAVPRRAFASGARDLLKAQKQRLRAAERVFGALGQECHGQSHRPDGVPPQCAGQTVAPRPTSSTRGHWPTRPPACKLEHLGHDTPRTPRPHVDHNTPRTPRTHLGHDTPRS